MQNPVFNVNQLTDCATGGPVDDPIVSGGTGAIITDAESTATLREHQRQHGHRLPVYFTETHMRRMGLVPVAGAAPCNRRGVSAGKAPFAMYNVADVDVDLRTALGLVGTLGLGQKKCSDPQ